MFIGHQYFFFTMYIWMRSIKFTKQSVKVCFISLVNSARHKKNIIVVCKSLAFHFFLFVASLKMTCENN